jgi:hypothetical protein
MGCEKGVNRVCQGVTWTRFALDPVGMRSQDMWDRDAASVRGV